MGVHCCTLPREERCARRTNPVRSTCTSTTPQVSEYAGADAYFSVLYSKIDPSELVAKVVLQARRLCCLRRDAAFSPESATGSSEAGSYREVHSALLQQEAHIVGGVLELAYYRATGDGQAFPTKGRYRVLD